MKHKKIFLVGLLLLAIITIGAVSATEALAVDDSGGALPDDSIIVENGGGVADDISDSSSKNVLSDDDDDPYEDDDDPFEDDEESNGITLIRTHHYKQEDDLLYVTNETIDITIDVAYEDEEWDVEFLTGSLVEVYLDGNLIETVETVDPDYDDFDYMISNNHVIISGIEKGKTYALKFVYNGTEEYDGCNATYLIKRVDCCPGFSISVPLAVVGGNNTAEIILYDTSKGLYYYGEDDEEYDNNESYIYGVDFEVLIYSVEYDTDDEGEIESSETLIYSGNHTTGIINLPEDLAEGDYVLEAYFVGDNDTYTSAYERCEFSVNVLYPYVYIVTDEEVAGENTTAVIYSALAIREEYNDDGDLSYSYYPVAPFDCELLVYLNNESYANVNCDGRFYHEMRGLYMSYAELNISGLKKGENVIKAVYDGSEGNFTAIEYIYSYGTLTGMNIDAPEKAFKGEDYEFTVSLYNLEDDHIINENFEVIVTFDSQSYDEDIGPIWERIVVLNETVCGNATLTLTSAELEKYNKSYFEIHASFVCENHTYSPSWASEDFSFYKVYTYINIDKPVYIEGEDYTFTVSLLDEEDDSIIYKEFDVEVYYYGDFGDEYLWEGTVNGTQTITITDEDISPIKEYDDCFHISAEFYDEDNDYSSSSIHITVDLYDEPEPVDEEINDITFDGPPCDGTIIEITDEELIIGYVLIPEWDDTVVGVNMTVNGKLVYVNSTATMEKEYLPLMEAYRYAVYMNFSHIKDKDIFVFQLDCYDDDVYWVYVAKVVGNNLVFYDGYSDEINYYVFYGNTTTKDLNDPEAMGPHPNGHFLELEIPDSCGITEGTVTISDGSKTLYTKSLSEIKEGYSYFVLGNSYAINLTDFDFSILPENRNVTVTFSSGNTTLSEKRIRIGDYVYLVNTPERIAEYFNITVADEKLIYGTDTVISIIGTDQLNPQSAVIDAGGGYFNVYVNGERIEDLGSLFEFDDEEEEYIPTELELGILGFREYRYFYLSLDDLGIFEDGKYNIRVTQYPGDADSSDNELSEYFYSTETEVLNKNVTVKFITLTNVVTPELFKYYVDKYGTLTDEFDELTFVGNFSNISCKYLGITSPVTLIGQDAYFEDLFFEIAEVAENVTIRNMILNYTDAINTPISTGELSKLVLDGNTINYDCKYHNGRAIASDAKDVSIINNRIYAYGGNTIADYDIGEKSINAIIIWGADKATVDNNILTAEADDYTSYGIRVYNSQGVTISNNVIAADLSIDLESSRAAINNNGIEGYMIVSGYNNTITYNNITTSAEYAIDLTDYTGNIVTNNNLFAQKTGNEAVKVNNDKNTIADNNVAKISTISLSDIVFDYGGSGSTTAVIANATGITDVKVLDKLKNPVNATVSVNGLKITVSGLDAGAYTLSATTVPATDYEASTATADITVNKVDSTLNADNIAFVYGQSGSTTVSYTGADDVSAVIAGHADSLTKEGNVITVSNLDAGVYVLTVATIADANHNSVSRDLTVNVSKAQSTLSVDNITFIFDEVGKGTVNYTGAIGVTAEIFNYPEASVTVNGNEITVSGLDTGKYKLIVTTTVDANHESVSEIADVTVNRIPSTISATDSVSFNYGSSGTVDVAYTGATGVTASVINHTEAVISITNSSVTVSGLAAGNYVLVVSTTVDGNHISASKSSNITVKKLSTTITASKVTATYAVSKNLVITLKANGKALSGKSVTVTVGSIKKTLKTNSKGQVSVQVSSLVPKTYTATVKFAGDVNYTGTSKKVTVVVKKNTPKITAKTKSFKRTQKTKSYAITIKNSKNKAIKGLKAYIKVNGVTYSATTNAKGVATFKINKLTKKGSYTSTITVKVTKYYNKVTKKVTIKAT